MENLRIGVPSKGRLAEIAAELLQQAGLSFRRQNRSLFARVRDLNVEIPCLRTLVDSYLSTLVSSKVEAATSTPK